MPTPLSPEQVGSYLSVSGATVRRWESGLSWPGDRELRSFAGLCGLSRFETEFLISTFGARSVEEPPQDSAFRLWAQSALSIEVPALVIDSLFYVRAWNAHATALFSSPITGASHILELLIASQPDALDHMLEPFGRWLRELWWHTADYCGTSAYRRMVRRLCRIPGLADLWRSLAFDRNPAMELGPIGMPYIVTSSSGDYRSFGSTVLHPTPYRLRIYFPVNKSAREHLDLSRDSTPSRVYFADQTHWSMD